MNSTRLSSIPDDYEDEDEDALLHDELCAHLLELESSDAEDPPAPPKGLLITRVTATRTPTHHISRTPAIPPAKPSLPVIIPGKLTPSILVITLQPIVKIVKDSLASYVSLANLTDAACIAFAEGHIRNASASLHNTASTGDNVPDYDELTLLSSTWNQGWKRYITLLKQFHPDRAIAWAAHHTLIFHDPTFDMEFQTWLRYDIQVRVHAMNKDLDPAVFQEHIFRAIEHNHSSFMDRAADMAATYAPSVEANRTTPNPAPPDPHKIVTPFSPPAWRNLLISLNLLDQFRNILPCLTHGFCIGVRNAITHTFIPPNHSSATDRPDVVDAHIKKELAEGHYSGPFSQSYLLSAIGNFCCAPLGVVDKPSTPGEFRIIQDFSFPRNNPNASSVNTEIDPDEFPCIWGFFNDVHEHFIHLDPPSTATTFDMDAAFCRVPIHTLDQPHLIVHWKGEFYVDHCAPFGAASSGSLFGCLGDVMMKILIILFVCAVFKWVDDFLIIRPPPMAPSGATSEDDIYNIAKPLGWLWKQSKTKGFTPLFDYLGFHWYIPSRIISIPQPKHEKYTTRISAWLDKGSVSLLDTQQVLGLLMHCMAVIPDRCAWLAGIICFSVSFPHAYTKCFIMRRIPDFAIAKARWWITRLTDRPVHIIAQPKPPVHPHPTFMDVSTSFGVTVIVNGLWGSWCLLHGWKTDGHNIGWAEMVVVEIALHILVTLGACDTSITFNPPQHLPQLHHSVTIPPHLAPYLAWDTTL
ncbi:hypothetical protein FRC06_004133 [Ceratobasidium sp. 370]|nr:hypothetical protein FRC06_004133 [Ceratobasidium sp. 370]